MGDWGPVAGLVAFAAVCLAAPLLWQATRRAARPDPLRPVQAATGETGPVGALVSWGRQAGRRALASHVEQVAREELAAWMARERLSPEAARRRLPPILVHLLDGEDAEAWWRREARASTALPGRLFDLWHAVASLFTNVEARRARYLDLMTQALMETVQA